MRAVAPVAAFCALTALLGAQGTARVSATVPKFAIASRSAVSPSAPSALPTPSASPTPAPVTLHIDAAYVTKNGSGAQALIMIPGLASGAYVWDALVPELATRYTVYTLTFAGFDGEPPVAPPYLDAFDRSVVDLIAQEHLSNPVLVGHDLGGHLVFRLAEELGGNIGGAFVIDGLAAFPPQFPGEKKSDRVETAAKYRDSILAASPAAYRADIDGLFATLVTDPKNVAMLAERSARSDQATFAGAAYEYFLADLRPGFAHIKVPVELLVPGPNDESASASADAYEVLYAGLPGLDVATIAPSKHFVMYDRPEQLRDRLDAYLNGLGL